MAALVLVLGVPEQTITDDFTLTGVAPTPLLVADWRTDNADREPRGRAYGMAPAEIMTRFLSDLKSATGRSSRPVTETLGLPPTFASARAHTSSSSLPPHLPPGDRDDIPARRPPGRSGPLAALPGIDQWKPGQAHPAPLPHPSDRGRSLAGPPGRPGGRRELWWDDPAAGVPNPPTAAYIHRLMTDRRVAPPGAGRHMLAEAERRIAAAGRPLSRLDCRHPACASTTRQPGHTVVGEQTAKDGGLGSPYAVTLLEAPPLTHRGDPHRSPVRHQNSRPGSRHTINNDHPRPGLPSRPRA